MTNTHATLSARLKAETHDEHERMHRLMAQCQPFADRERYAHFVAAQYLFQRDVEHLFTTPGMRSAVTDLEVRGREAAALADLADLGAAVPQEQRASAALAVAMPGALGWLYVSEGSTLGAAFLFKQAKEDLGLSAEFGARNLAAYPEGRMVVWRRFVASLDSNQFSAADHDLIVAGAFAAYQRFGELLQRQFALENAEAAEAA